MKSWYERSVEYDGDLNVAAQEVIAELDPDDGVIFGSKDFELLIREKAREHKVGRKDLKARVLECYDPE